MKNLFTIFLLVVLFVSGTNTTFTQLNTNATASVDITASITEATTAILNVNDSKSAENTSIKATNASLNDNLSSANLKKIGGTFNVPGDYPTLTGASGLFAAINSAPVTENITVNITANITEDGTNALNQWTEEGAGGYTLTIRPDGTTERVISGNVANGMIRLNGADRVIIDGRFQGSGRYLRFRNIHTSNPTFTFINDATYNTITYCIIETGTSAAQVGGILFSTTTGTLGNSNNTISYCDVRDRTDASGIPLCGIVSNGTASAQNSNNTIDNCNIYNFYQNGNPGIGIYLTTGSNAWTISNNSLYQTVTRTSTTTNTRLFPITIVNSGAGYQVIGNYIGGTAPQCGGTAMTLTTSTGGVNNFIYAIYISTVGVSPVTNIQGNVIRNISITTMPPNTANVFNIGILAATGSFNIVDNTIGSNTGNGSITMNNNSTAMTSSYSLFLDGMQLSPSGTLNVSGNIIGSMTLGGTLTQTANNFLRGMLLVGSPTATVTVDGNLFGSNITSNSLYANMGTAARTSSVIPIITSLSTAVIASITNNTINNIRSNSTSNSINTGMTGIQVAGTGVIANVTGNTISNMATPSTYASTTPGSNPMTGIYINSTGTNQILCGNTINNLSLTTTSSVANAVYGIAINASGSMGNVYKNRIYGLTTTSTSTSARIYGTNNFVGSNWTYSNNQIALTNGANTNALDIQGIHEEMGTSATANFYYNSVYIGGSVASGTTNSFAFNRTIATTVNLMNNLFFNARTGGTGYHVGLSNNTSATGWSSTASNYNTIIGSDASTVCRWNGTNYTIAGFRTQSGGDANSYSELSSVITPANLFSDIANGNLNINTNNIDGWILNGKGIAISTINNDFNENNRSTTVGIPTDIGTHEFTLTVDPPSAVASGAPAHNTTTTYTFAGRRLGSIAWGGSGTVPTAVDFKYFSGDNPPGSPVGKNAKSYWTITATDGSGYTYDLTLDYSSAELGTITSENNIIIGKHDAYWLPQSSIVNTTDKTVTAGGLSSFSDFTLTDNSDPLPIQLASFVANINPTGSGVLLEWTTISEINNYGFNVERRKQNDVDFFEIPNSFVAGHGTTIEQHDYSFIDNTLIENGVYEYRLKQVDNNGLFSYCQPIIISISLLSVRETAPIEFRVHQNYPNPFNPKTTIKFSVEKVEHATLVVYNSLGQEVARLFDGIAEPGYYYKAELDGTSIASGLYFYRVITGSKSELKKMILLK